MIAAGFTDSGVMEHALGNENEPIAPYSTFLPTGTDAGIYFIWYRVTGDAMHDDVPEDYVVGIIADPEEERDDDEIRQIAAGEPGSLILITCENESMDGGYLNRRVVFAKPKP